MNKREGGGNKREYQIDINLAINKYHPLAVARGLMLVQRVPTKSSYPSPHMKPAIIAFMSSTMTAIYCIFVVG